MWVFCEHSVHLKISTTDTARGLYAIAELLVDGLSSLSLAELIQNASVL